MSHTASYHFGATHPLAGVESWPKTGPIYGISDDDDTPRRAGFWEKLGERFRKEPPSESPHPSQARIWY